MKNQLTIYFDSMMDRITQRSNSIDLNSNNVISDLRQIIFFLKTELAALKGFISSYTFENEAEEIDFFKNKKPAVLSRLIYFNQIYRIEISNPFTPDAAKEHFLNEIERLKKELKKETDFYYYHRSGATHYDKFYFTRGQEDINVYTEAFFFETDYSFSTFYDYKVAAIIATEKLFTHLLGRIEGNNIDHKRDRELCDLIQAHYNWTETKAALVELIYGLYAVGCLNKGDVELNELAQIFSLVFNIDLEGFYHAYQALKTKKKNPTSFLEKMLTKLREYMQREEE